MTVPALDVAVRATSGAFSLDVRFSAPRRHIAIVGPNGAGKSTLLRVLAGALPYAGTVKVGPRALERDGQPLPPESREVGYLPQSAQLFPHLTVLGNLRFGARRSDERNLDELIDALGLRALLDRRPRTLSGGEQQRAALGRSLAPQPELLLLDEPTTAVDVAARPSVRATLKARTGVLVAVTHELADLRAWDPWIVHLDGGHVRNTGDLDALTRAEDPFLAALLRG